MQCFTRRIPLVARTVLRTPVQVRTFFRGPPGFWGGGGARHWGRRSWPEEFFNKSIEEFIKDSNRFWTEPGSRFWYPFRVGSNAAEEAFYARNPIVEENGTKKFKTFYDVSRFSPEDIHVKSSSKDGKVTITAKREHSQDGVTLKDEFHREFSVPEGVKIQEMTCTYTEEGGMVLEAPYDPPSTETQTKTPKEPKSIPITNED